MIRRPPRSTLFPTRRSSDLGRNTKIPDALRLRHPCPFYRAICNAPGRTVPCAEPVAGSGQGDRKSTRLNSSHTVISYAVFCLKKKKTNKTDTDATYHPTPQS